MNKDQLIGSIGLAGVLIVAVTILAVKDRWVARVERKTGRKRGGRPWHEPVQDVMGRILLGLFAVLGVVGLVRWIRAGFPIGENALLGAFYGGILLVVVVVLVALQVLVIWLRNNDRDVNASIATAQGGDPERAIAELKAIIEAKGPTVNRLNGLGLLHGLRESWDEALAAFDEAIRLGGRRPGLLSNRAIMLWKTGRLDEAEAACVEAIGKNRQDFQLAINHANVLVDLGRVDEARAEIDRAEEIHRRMGVVLAGKATRDALEQQFRQQVDSVYARIAAVSPEKKGDLTGLDEL